MRLSRISLVYLKEMRDLLRDRRTLMSVVLVPTVIMPALMLGVGRIAAGVMRQARAEIPSVMLLGGADSPQFTALFSDAGHFRRIPYSDDWRQRISDKRLRAAVEVPPGFDASLQAGSPATVTIYDFDGELKSRFAVGQIEQALTELSQRTVAARLASRGLPATLVEPFETRRENVAAPEKVGGNLVGGIVPYVVVLRCFTGAMYPALDLTAGEKERGTLEMLLCSSAARAELVFGKFLAVLTGSLGAVACSSASLGLCYALVTGGGGAAGMGGGGGVGGGAGGSGAAGAASGAVGAAAEGGFALHLDPLGVLCSVAMIVPAAVLFSAILFSVGLFARSYREAQSYAAPLVIVVILPVAIGLLPGIELVGGLTFVPILNLSLVCREMLSGVWHPLQIVFVLASTSAYAAAALAIAVRMFNREEVLFRT